MAWGKNKIIIISKAFFLIGLAFLVSGCSQDNNVTRNIRVIAQAEVDGKIIEGSAVMSIRWEPCCNGGVQAKHNTEAVILELNDKHTVYVLDATIWPDGERNASYWSGYVGNALGVRSSARKSDFDLIRNATGKYPVLASISNTKTMPVMVSFKDETKRETMFHVTPENFSQNFGASVKFIGLWFKFTDDPITEAIEARLPRMFKTKNNESWRKKYPLKDENGKLTPRDQYEFPQKFGKRSFKKKRF